MTLILDICFGPLQMTIQHFETPHAMNLALHLYTHTSNNLRPFSSCSSTYDLLPEKGAFSSFHFLASNSSSPESPSPCDIPLRRILRAAPAQGDFSSEIAAL